MEYKNPFKIPTILSSSSRFVFYLNPLWCNYHIKVTKMNDITFICRVGAVGLLNSWIPINESQATHITFICPMRFDAFPLDTQVIVYHITIQYSTGAR